LTALGSAACTQAGDDEQPSTERVAGADAPESQKSLEEILETPFDEWAAEDLDLVRFASGELSSAEYVLRYPGTALVAEERKAALAAEAVSFDAPDARVGQTSQALTTLTPGVWNTVQVPAGRCSDGSPYKVFVMPAEDPAVRASGELVVFLEPGGACWDYPSCTGQAGIRGAANPNGIPDNFMSIVDFLDPNTEGGSVNPLISPLLYNASAIGIEPNRVQTDRWNKVFMPYCTGDVHSGNQITRYSDPEGVGPDIDFFHYGAVNVDASLAILQSIFTPPADLLVTGCSAGGAGAMVNYRFFREALQPLRSTLLNDSGPIFTAPGSGLQFPLHQEISAIWNVDFRLDQLEAASGLPISGDFGLVNEANAVMFPGDRLGITLLRQDFNYSVYSYARFYGFDENSSQGENRILDFWNDDIDNLVDQYDGYSNLYYHLPFYRSFNDSHCTTILNWSGTQIRSSGYFVNDFIDDLLDPSASPRNSDEGFYFWDYFVFNFPTWLGDLILGG
ncbi:MAG: pectin acetylesterase-family hydrolase, partial [Myxococcota bacterium]